MWSITKLFSTLNCKVALKEQWSMIRICIQQLRFFSLAVLSLVSLNDIVKSHQSFIVKSSYTRCWVCHSAFVVAVASSVCMLMSLFRFSWDVVTCNKKCRLGVSYHELSQHWIKRFKEDNVVLVTKHFSREHDFCPLDKKFTIPSRSNIWGLWLQTYFLTLHIELFNQLWLWNVPFILSKGY